MFFHIHGSVKDRAGIFANIWPSTSCCFIHLVSVSIYQRHVNLLTQVNNVIPAVHQSAFLRSKTWGI